MTIAVKVFTQDFGDLGLDPARWVLDVGQVLVLKRGELEESWQVVKIESGMAQLRRINE